MTPKGKAEELFDKYDDYPLTYHWKKECALIAIDEILKAVEGKYDQYWQEVKQEIEKL